VRAGAREYWYYIQYSAMIGLIGVKA